MRTVLRILPCLALMAATVLEGSAFAAEDEEIAHAAAPLPTDRSAWLNSSPFTWEQLKGKGVCLYFFECDSEGIEVLPKYLEAAKKHSLDPIVFIGVAMGTDRFNSEKFLQGKGYSFPTICDPTYLYVRQCDEATKAEGDFRIMGTVCHSLYVTPKGHMEIGFWDEPEETVSAALEGAAWNSDPKEVPEELRPLWRCIEFRKFSEALPLFKPALKASAAEQKEGARKLHEIVTGEIDRTAEEIREANEAGRKWDAYAGADQLLEEFRGYDIPKDIEPLKKKLTRSSDVKAGLTAQKQLPQIAQNLLSPNAAIRGKARTQLEKIKSDFEGSDLGRRAEKLLETPAASPK